MGAVGLAFSMEGMYGDGMNLYEYLGSNPWNRSDPLGLSWDPFSMVDDYLAETAGSRAAFLTQIGQDAAAVAVVTATIASYLPFPGVGALGDLALYALGEQTGTETATMLALGVIPGGKLLGNFGSYLSKIGSSAWRGAKHYAGNFGRAIFNYTGPGAALRLGKMALDFIRKGRGCFEAGTRVWALRGRVPIEQIEQGDFVYAQDESTGELSLREVVRTFVRRAAPIVAVTVTTAAGAQQTLDTTEEHPFHTDARGWVEAQGLCPGEHVTLAEGEPGTVLAVQFTPRRADVYNIEVEGLHNYFVGRDGRYCQELWMRL